MAITTLRSIAAGAAVVAACLLPNMADAQCRSFAKNKCIPQLEPYTFNETFNAAQLSPGEEAEVNMTFYSGQEYRLLVCVHPSLGDVNWKLVDAGNRIVFESLADEPKSTFDLKVESTTQLKVQVYVPEKKAANDLVPVGCVTILMGYKK